MPAPKPTPPLVTAGSVVASATTGALVGIGHRMGGATIPLVAIASVLGRSIAGRGVLLQVLAGLVVHVAGTFVWTAIGLGLAARLAHRTVLAALLVAAANFLVGWLVAWSTGNGLATVLALGDRIAYAVALAAALVVGIRFALPRRETDARLDRDAFTIM